MHRLIFRALLTDGVREVRFERVDGGLDERVRDHFEARVGRFAQLQHEFNERLEDFERRTAKKPFLYADEAWEGTRGMVGVLRKQSIDLFGLDVKHYGPLIRRAVFPQLHAETRYVVTTPAR